MIWLTLLALLPLVGGIVAGLVRGRAGRTVGLLVSLVTLALAGYLAVLHLSGTDLSEQVPWIPAFGAYYALSLDGMGLLMVLLTALLVPVVLIAERHRDDEGRWSASTFTALVLVLESFALYVFLAADVLVFYIVFEVTLIPMYFLIAGWGGPERARAAVKFLLYSLAGGLVMLFGVVGLGFAAAQNGMPSYLLSDLTQVGMSPWLQTVLFWSFFVAFAIKAPMVPVHTWLPSTAEQASPGTSTLLVGILDKIGTFGMIKFCLALFPAASARFAPYIVALAVVSILYGAIAAIGQRNLYRLVAFTSVSHFGFMVLGIFVFTTASVQGSVIYMLNHGFSTAVLFLAVGYLARRRGSAEITDFGGVMQVAPVAAGVLLVGGLAGLSLPGMGSFVGEFLVLAGAWSRWPWVAAIATAGMVLAALYILIMYQRVATGPVTEQTRTSISHDLTGLERLAMVPVIGALLLVGFFPKPVLDMVAPVARQAVASVGQTDPVPAVGGKR